MSAAKPPRLMRGGLTGRIYVTTSYVQKRNGLIVSNTKFDVTKDFEAIEAERRREDTPPLRPPPGDFECCASGRCEVCSPGYVWGRDG